jgi:hypothetical protein
MHHAEVTVIEGDSYRVRESERETAVGSTLKRATLFLWQAVTSPSHFPKILFAD